MSRVAVVGLFTAFCLAVLGWLIFSIEDWSLGGDDGRVVDVLFDSVAGLNEKAPVRVAGVRVGTVGSISLEGRRARVRLELEQAVPLTEGTRAAVANAGILGDKYVELIPGPQGAPPLPDDVRIPGDTPVTFDEALARFDSLGQSLQELTGDVSSRGDLGASIRRLLDNLEATSADIRDLVATNRSQIDSTVSNFERFSESLANELPTLTAQVGDLLQHLDSLVVDNRDDVEASLDSIRTVAKNLETTVDNLNEITGQVKSGEGTVGKLLYDNEAHDKVVATLDSVKDGVDTLGDTIGRIRDIELELGMEGAVYSDIDESGAAFGLDFRTRHPRRYYRLGIADSPQGDFDLETRTVTVTHPDGTVETTIIEEQKQTSDYTFNALLGYRFDHFDLRAGIIESSGGAAIDLRLAEDRFTVSLEAFDFSRPGDLDPHLRLTTRIHLTPNIYVLGGYDDPLESQFESVFFGAGIRWKDDDLKYLLGSLPSGF
ncbi:MAG: MCE family protein [Thermoanaerobaculia bacterium]|nr:MCE family protein [Thermoanaerobaculia bacterium]